MHETASNPVSSSDGEAKKSHSYQSHFMEENGKSDGRNVVISVSTGETPSEITKESLQVSPDRNVISDNHFGNTNHSQEPTISSVDKEIEKLRLEMDRNERRKALEIQQMLAEDLEKETAMNAELGLKKNLGLSPSSSTLREQPLKIKQTSHHTSKVSGHSSEITNIQIHDDHSGTKTSNTSTTKAMNNATEIKPKDILPVRDMKREALESSEGHYPSDLDKNKSFASNPQKVVEFRETADINTSEEAPEPDSPLQSAAPKIERNGLAHYINDDSFKSYSSLIHNHSKHMEILEQARKNALKKIKDKPSSHGTSSHTQSQSNLSDISRKSNTLSRSRRLQNTSIGAEVEEQRIFKQPSTKEFIQPIGGQKASNSSSPPSRSSTPIPSHIQHMEMLSAAKQKAISRFLEEHEIMENEEFFWL